ncbi:MAG: hypothetical protein AABZ59_04005, partial [Candidatus Binatota bacterium]
MSGSGRQVDIAQPFEPEKIRLELIFAIDSVAFVRLIKPALRSSATDVEAFVVTLLARKNGLPYRAAVFHVAEFLFHKELCAG